MNAVIFHLHINRSKIYQDIFDPEKNIYFTGKTRKNTLWIEYWIKTSILEYVQVLEEINLSESVYIYLGTDFHEKKLEKF